GPAKGSADVVVLLVEAAQANRLLCSVERAARSMGQIDEPLEVPISHLNQLAGSLGMLDGELAQRLQQPIARLAVVALDQDQRLVDQLRQEIDHWGLEL